MGFHSEITYSWRKCRTKVPGNVCFFPCFYYLKSAALRDTTETRLHGGCLETTLLTEKIMLFGDTWSHVVKYKCLREEITAFPQPLPTDSNQKANKCGENNTKCGWLGSDLASRQKQKQKKSILGSKGSFSSKCTEEKQDQPTDA